MFLQRLAALIHFHQDDGLPDQVGEGGAAAPAFGNALFQRRAGFPHPTLLEGLEQAVEEDLRFALFIALDVLLAPLDEGLEQFSAIHVGILTKPPGFVTPRGRVGWLVPA